MSAFQPTAGKPILHSAGIDSAALTLAPGKIGHALWVEEAPAATKSFVEHLIVQPPLLLHQPRSHSGHSTMIPEIPSSTCLLRRAINYFKF